MFKKSFCLLFVLIALSTPYSAIAENEASAFLSNVCCEKNRLFETYLSVNIEVCAFIAILEFDESKVEFREATALSEDTVISVNNSEKGKVTLAFLNKNGIKGEVLKLTFKAKADSTDITLNLEQVINRKGEDIVLSRVMGAMITSSSDTADKSINDKEKKDKPETQPQPTAADINKDILNLNISAKETAATELFICIVLMAVLILSVGITGLILGKNFNSNRKNNYEKDS